MELRALVTKTTARQVCVSLSLKMLTMYADITSKCNRMSFASIFLNILKTCSENIKLSSVLAYTKIVIQVLYCILFVVAHLCDVFMSCSGLALQNMRKSLQYFIK